MARRRLPPLNAIRAFEAAARHRSFVDAADELAVTPSAISQQVKQLEDWLAQPLFRRLPRGLSITELGKAYLPPLTDALDLMETATRQAVEGPGGRTLRITCLASFGAQWLTPRLHRFNAKHPEIDVLIATFDRLVDLETEEFDVAIRYGTRSYPGLQVEDLMRDSLGVVCSPDLIDDADHPIRAYEDLAHHTLMHDADARVNGPMDWESFLGQVGTSLPGPGRGPRFSDSHMMIQACIAGRGVMIGRSGLIADSLDSGVLIAPFGMPLKAEGRYRLVMLPGALADPKIAAFRTWLYEEIEAMPAICGS